MKTAVIVLPTYNEAGNIEVLIPQIFEITRSIAGWNVEVLVVDSKSRDKTAELVRQMQWSYSKLHLLSTEKEGLGKAYWRGFQYAIDKLRAFIVFEMDSDLSHDPGVVPEFLKQIELGADFVIGSRYIKGGSIPANWATHRKILSRSANHIARLGFMKPKIREWTNGYRAIRTWIIKEALNHVENYSGYVFQIALLDFAIKRHAIIEEIPIHFRDRTIGSSKISPSRYMAQTLLYIFRHSTFIHAAFAGAVGLLIARLLFCQARELRSGRWNRHPERSEGSRAQSMHNLEGWDPSLRLRMTQAGRRFRR